MSQAVDETESATVRIADTDGGGIRVEAHADGEPVAHLYIGDSETADALREVAESYLSDVLGDVLGPDPEPTLGTARFGTWNRDGW